MTGSAFDGASMAVTVLRARKVDASVVWYRDKLGLEPLHVGADGPGHPFATFSVAGSVVTLWQLPQGQARATEVDDTGSYMVIVLDADLESVRIALAENGVRVSEVRQSAKKRVRVVLRPRRQPFRVKPTAAHG